MRFAAPIYVGQVSILPLAPLPTTEVLPANAAPTPSGGAMFDLDGGALSPVYPAVIKAFWLPSDWLETPEPQVVLDSGAPSRELVPTGAGHYQIEPDSSVPAGTYKLALVPGFAE